MFNVDTLNEAKEAEFEVVNEKVDCKSFLSSEELVVFLIRWKKLETFL